MINAGVSKGVAMKITGHKTPEVFKRYHITTLTDLAEAAKRIETHTLTHR
jgi:hypothetical protein